MENRALCSWCCKVRVMLCIQMQMQVKQVKCLLETCHYQHSKRVVVVAANYKQRAQAAAGNQGKHAIPCAVLARDSQYPQHRHPLTHIIILHKDVQRSEAATMS
jgi:hypothetical protein